MPTRTAKLLGQLTLDRQYKAVRPGITEQLLPQGLNCCSIVTYCLKHDGNAP